MAVKYLTDQTDDGTVIGVTATEKLGFWGATTPVVQSTLYSGTNNTTVVTSSTAAAFATTTQAQRVLDDIERIKTVLNAYGFTRAAT